MDQAYTSKYLGVARMLWNASEDISDIPQHYLDHLQYTYSDGSISLAHLLGKFEYTEGLETEELEEAIELLGKVNPEDWPFTEDIESVDVQELLKIYEHDATEEFNFVEDNLSTADKVEKVLTEVISSVFGARVNTIRNRNGKYASPDNQFLQHDDGTFEGTFKYDGNTFKFEVAPAEDGWICTYRMSEKDLDQLPPPPKPKTKEGRRVRARGW